MLDGRASITWVSMYSNCIRLWNVTDLKTRITTANFLTCVSTRRARVSARYRDVVVVHAVDVSPLCWAPVSNLSTLCKVSLETGAVYINSPGRSAARSVPYVVALTDVPDKTRQSSILYTTKNSLLLLNFSLKLTTNCLAQHWTTYTTFYKLTYRGVARGATGSRGFQSTTRKNCERINAENVQKTTRFLRNFLT